MSERENNPGGPHYGGERGGESAGLFDAAGSVIGGGFTFPHGEVPPGGRIGFETSAAGVAGISRSASVQASVEAEVTS